MLYNNHMYAPAAKKLRKTTFSQGIDPHSSTFTSNSGPVAVFFVSGVVTGKERDPETGLYYYGARYLDPRTSRWISADPAMWEGDYIPSAPINDQAKERNQNLPGIGGIFNYVNFHVYHYGGNNPIKLMDPDGRDFYNFSDNDYYVKPESGDEYVLVKPGEMYVGKIDGAISAADGTVIKVTDDSRNPYNVDISVFTIDGQDDAFFACDLSRFLNNIGDRYKERNEPELILSGVYRQDVLENYEALRRWGDAINNPANINTERSGVEEMPLRSRSFLQRTLINRSPLIERN